MGLALAASTLVVLDGVSTFLALRVGVEEANPLMAKAIATFGSGAALGIRTAVLVALIAYLNTLEVPLARQGLALITTMYGLLLAWHIYGHVFVLDGVAFT